MVNIAVDDATFEKLSFSAALMGCSTGEVVRLLVTRRARARRQRHTQVIDPKS